MAFLGGVTWRQSTLFVMDHVLIVAAVFVAATVRLGLPDPEFALAILWRAVIVAVVLQLSLHYCDLYAIRTAHSRRDLVVGIIQAMGATSLVLAVVYYWVPTLIIGRGTFLLTAVFTVLFILGWRLLYEWISSRVGPREKVMIVGTSGAAVALAREIEDRRLDLGVEFVGFIEAERPPDRPADDDARIVGSVREIPQVARTLGVDRVIVSLADARGKLSMDELLRMKLIDGVRFDHLASVYEEYTGKIAVENLRPSWLIFSEGFRKTRVLSAAKRFLDVMLAFCGIVLSGPVMAIVAVGVRLNSPGPAIYSQKRVGLNGRPFMVHKFRSMYADAEARTGAVWAKAGDPRVTTVGRILRRTRLDELPQFWNILRGDMSFVGPRPERPEFVENLTLSIPFYGQRHVVRPGLTGWAQVRHKYGATVEDSIEKLQYDLYYIKNMSLAFDMFVIAETVKTVLVRQGS
jgi:sugar transferase (PEP-CTERM system associated)